MCGCELHSNGPGPCTCRCPHHEGYRREDEQRMQRMTDASIIAAIPQRIVARIIADERTRIATAIEALHYDAPAARIAQATAARIARQGGAL